MRRIQLTKQEKAQILANITKDLNDTRLLNDGINIKYKPMEVDCPHDIFLTFTALAWLKMQTLVDTCNTECAWHGVVDISANRRHFTVKDIFTYPQVVTSATVNIDEATYETWHQSLDDKTYNSLRLQGHSHVKMGVTPSGTDLAMYDNFLQTLSNDSFYIFLIMNQNGSMWINIYDLAANAIYDKSDITVNVEGVGSLADWYKAAKQHINTYTAPRAASTKQDSKGKITGGYFSNYREYQDYIDNNSVQDAFHATENFDAVNKYLMNKKNRR